nr:MAG TPA: Protein of unknown function (DUF512) [Bacteriophage sp.]
MSWQINRWRERFLKHLPLPILFINDEGLGA